MLDPVTQALRAAFEPHPLTPAQHPELWVELDEERSAVNGVAIEIVSKVQYANRPTHHVVAGHRGSGKSTELLRAQDMLQSGDPRCFTVYADLSQDVDYNDVDLLDVLVAMVRHLATDLSDRLNVKLQAGYFRDRAAQLWKLLTSEIIPEKIEVSALATKLAVAIKASPDARAELRKAFEPDAGNWLKAFNDVIEDALAEVVAKGYKDLCLIVDDLDKLSRVQHATAGCPISENLFVNRAPQLTQLACHVVYSVPLELAMSHHAPALQQSYGGAAPIIPMVKVMDRPPSVDRHAAGIASLREVIRRRCDHAGVAMAALCDPAVVDDLIVLSGGQPAELMTLVSDCVLRRRPFGADVLERIRVRGEREYQFLRRDHWAVLDSVSRNGLLDRTVENDEAIRELLQSRALLQYQNGEVWYRPNPYTDRIPRPS